MSSLWNIAQIDMQLQVRSSEILMLSFPLSSRDVFGPHTPEIMLQDVKMDRQGELLQIGDRAGCVF